jgi:hypothetical protein
VHAGNRLEQIGRKVFASNLLDPIYQLVDAQLRGVDSRLSGGQQVEIIVELRTIARNLLGLGRLGIARRHPQELDLGLGRSEPGPQSVREIFDVGALALHGVAQGIELRITHAWLMELALDAIELALPKRDCRLNIDPHVLVGAPDDLGSVDLRSRWGGGGLGGADGQPRRANRGIRLCRIDRHVARRLRGLGTRAAHTDEEAKQGSARNFQNVDDHVATSKGKTPVRALTPYHGHIKAASR